MLCSSVLTSLFEKQAACTAYVEAKRRTELRSEKYKINFCFHRPVLCLALYQSNPICPRHPGLLWEVIKRLAAYQLHGNLTPGRFSIGCPHWLRRFYHARPVTGQEYRQPHCRSSPCREPPDTYSQLFLALCWKEQTKDQIDFFFRWCLVVFFLHIMAQPLTWLMLITKQWECT